MKGLEEQNLASIIIEAEKSGLSLMGDGLIGYKFVGGVGESSRIWNMILEKFIPEDFEFSNDFFECYAIFPKPYDSSKWN